ncbi:universal stress protein [Solimonas fluminis]|nr:universal stress protein [Solimonas fluminis]
MTQFRSLFLLADPRHPRSPAFERTRALALASGARVHVAAFGYDRAIAAVALASRSAMEQARDGYMAGLRHAVEQQAASLRELGLQVTCSAAWAHPALPEILVGIAEQQADLAIVDAAEQGLAQRLLSQSPDQQLLRRCPVPLMRVLPGDRSLPHRVLVAIDVLEEPVQNMRLLRDAGALALQCDATLRLAYVSEPFVVAGSEVFAGGGAGERMEAEIERLRRERFDAFVAGVHLPAELAHYLEGPAAEALCRFAAEQGCDVMALGVVPRDRLERWLIGNTAEQVLHHAPCGLLALPAAG